MNTSFESTLASRRRAMFTGLAALLAPLGWAHAEAPAAPLLVEIWKAPGCDCCEDWMQHLKANGFRTLMHEGGNTAMRARLGIADRFGSCHTAIVGGYALEGHVPAREIRRLLKEKPAARGLAVPGMPIGSPAMDGPAYAGRRDPFDVLLIDKNGEAGVYRRYA